MIQSSGVIKFSEIRGELGVPLQVPFLLRASETGSYVSINPCSTSKPDGTGSSRISEWYSYDHNQACPPPPPPPSQWSVRYNNNLGTICETGLQFVYTSGSFTTGSIVYSDSGLTTLLTGYNYISELTSGFIYEINPTTAEIQVNTGNSC